MRGAREGGFTIVEVIVVIVLASIIFLYMSTSLTNIFSISEASSQRLTASNLAYGNLRLFADNRAPLWFSCNTSDQTATITLLDTTEPVDRLPGDVAQTVTARAPYGCDASNKGYPLLVTSTVTLINGIEASHATYTTF